MDEWILLPCEGTEEGNGIVMDVYEKIQGVSCLFLLFSFCCSYMDVLCETSSLLFSLFLFLCPSGFFCVLFLFKGVFLSCFVFLYYYLYCQYVCFVALIILVLTLLLLLWRICYIVRSCCVPSLLLLHLHLLVIFLSLFLSYVLQKQCVSLV